jgi:hypothetical protein
MMTERERVQALVEEGKITEEEAQLLLEAIDEADVAEAEADAFVAGVSSDTGSEPTSPSAPTPPPQPDRPASPQGSGAPRVESPTGLRWLTIKMMAKNLEIRVDESLSEPQVEGAELERDGSGWRIETQKLEGLLSRFGGAVGEAFELDIRLPPEVGVSLDAKAGNVEVKDVPFFRGRVAAGNVELTRVRGIDLELKAGNLDAELLLAEGEHRVQVSMGNADVEILRGSSVRINGRASMGSLNMKGPSKLGEGKASLDLLVKMGNLDVMVPRE